MEKVSVIIPVYKVENYLDKCVESVVSQTYQNLEIILVDDGSPDNCPKMCDEWAKKDKRIRVIHKENGGVSSARNEALDKFEGDYVCFVDSDDSIHPDYVKILLNTLKNNRSDIAVCSWKKVKDMSTPRERIYKHNLLKIKNFKDREVFELIYNKKIPMIMALWTKIYKRKIFEDIRFQDLVVAEDDAVLHLILNKCKKVSYVDCALYYYTQRGNSLTTSTFSKKKLRSLYVFKNRIDFIEKNQPEFKEKAIHHYIRILILYYHYSKWSKMGNDISNKIKEEIDSYIKKGYTSKITKLFKKCPRLLNLILKIRQRLI